VEGLASGEVWRLPGLARLVDPPLIGRVNAKRTIEEEREEVFKPIYSNSRMSKCRSSSLRRGTFVAWRFHKQLPNF
jgi:hypothetical protein